MNMGRLFVRFERTTLAHVIKEARVGAIGHRGDAGGSEHYLCFTIVAAPTSYRLWLISSEMGGEVHAVTGIFAESYTGPASDTESCPPLPSTLQPVALDRGIWIGTSREELRRKPGDPSESQADWLAFNFAGKVRGPYRHYDSGKTEMVDWDVSSNVEIKLRNGLVDAVGAQKVTSY
jgi:hypothetical protein